MIKCKDCTVGFLDFGFHPKNLTAKEYKEYLKQEPVVGRKYFTKYYACPFCAKVIDWDFEEKEEET